MSEVKEKDTRATSINCVFMSIDIILGFFGSFGRISNCFAVFL